MEKTPTTAELNDRKLPIVRIDDSLKKYKTMPIFQEKVDKANEMLKTIGLPKILKNNKIVLVENVCGIIKY